MATRRDLLKLLAGSSGLMVLRAAAVGLPVSFLRQPLAHAADACSPAILTDPNAPDFLLMSLSFSGDPLNANTPGSYVSESVNNPNPDMAPVNFKLGAYATRAALPWSTLPAAMAARTGFVHHRTGAIGHNQFSAVTKLMGAMKNPEGRGEESLPAGIAQETAAALGTLQAEPVSLSSAPVTMGGMAVQTLKPSSLFSLFTPAESALNDLAGLRDTTVDALHAALKANGTRSQKRFLDRYVAGRDQARTLGDCLGTLLEELPLVAGDVDGARDQMLGAIALFKLNVTPVVTITMPFGGDNHTDEDFTREKDQTVASVEALKYMWTKLSDYGLADRVTFANLNVFGRTILRADGGRSHNQEHHVMVITSRRLKGGVYGGLARNASDFGATAIDSASGASRPSADIPVEETLQAAAKTMAAAVGVSTERVDTRITGGKIIRAAMK